MVGLVIAEITIIGFCGAFVLCPLTPGGPWTDGKAARRGSRATATFTRPLSQGLRTVSVMSWERLRTFPSARNNQYLRSYLP